MQPRICSRCKKNLAVIFITRVENGKNITEGLCLNCARELKIKPVEDLVQNLGLTDEDLDNLSGGMNDALEALGNVPVIPEEDADSESDDGKTATFPFLSRLMNSENLPQESDSSSQSAPPPPRRDPKEQGKGRRKALENYCISLSQRAREGKLDRMIGREEELERVIQILNRRQKNNPCLIGEPGVGKTAIAEGLAQRIAEGKVPYKLRDKEVYLLDLTALVAGTQFRGQFESRMKALIEDIRKQGNVILVIDEVHNIVGAGDAEGSMNAANILKPALSRGEIQVIGATTFAEYRKHIEKDSALERRFQPVTVAEPSIADATEILKGVAHYYEDYHGVRIPPEMCALAVTLSERYITDRFLPDKAIDLIDEACSDVNLKNKSLERLDEVMKDRADLDKERELLLADSEGEHFERLAELRSMDLRLADEQKQLEAQGRPVLGPDNLARVIELWTHIPASSIRTDEFVRLAELDKRLKEHIVGQDEAVETVCSAIKRNRLGLSAKRKPVSFIFVGSTGVGKTELVKCLAADLFNAPESLIRLDMSEFMEKHSVSRIIGSPPGYVGYDEAGQLTEKIRRKPYSVVLFDEIEKAHPDVLNILLQILDDGRITDAQGRTVNFENTVICMTSNAGSTEKTGETGFAKTPEQISANKAMKALGEFLRPEFLGRVDEVIAFKPLGEESLERIAALVLDEYVQSLAEKGVTFTYTPAACRVLVKEAGSKFGARDLRRTIRKRVEDPLAERFVAGTLSGAVTLDAKEDRLELV